MGKHKERRQPPDDVVRLIGLILGEVESPADLQQLLDGLPPLTECLPQAVQFLKAKDRAQRREAFIKTERLWFNKYGWFMARVITLFGVLVLVWALLARGAAVNFFTGVILGAAGYYLLLMTLSNWRYRDRNKRRRRLLEQEGERYQREIVQIAASLMRQFQLDPARYPVARPRSAAGLEQRESGYFIPVD